MTYAHSFSKNTAVAKAYMICLLFLFARILQAQPLTGWKLVWSDEFSGATYSGKQYTATQISSRNKGSWKYCRIDVRAKLPYGQGIWPAIWMMPQQPVAYGGWPRSGEIDIMENLGDNTRLTYTTLHFGNSNQSVQGKYTVPANQTLSDSFHVYTMVWDSGSFSFTLDSVHNYYTTKNWSPDNVSYPKPFDQPFFLMFDLAVGGSWGGLPDSTTVFPQKFLIDWVRVYQRQPASLAQPAKPVGAGSGLSVRSIANRHAIVIHSQDRGRKIVRLINVAGECVLRKETMLDGQTEIQTHGLPAGVYQVDVTLPTGAEAMKTLCVVSK